jgi:hypothetical protein
MGLRRRHGSGVVTYFDRTMPLEYTGLGRALLVNLIPWYLPLNDVTFAAERYLAHQVILSQGGNCWKGCPQTAPDAG